MPPAIPSNHTGGQVYLWFRVTSNDNDDRRGETLRILKMIFGPPSFPNRYHTDLLERDPEDENTMEQQSLSGSTLPSSPEGQSSNDELLHYVAFKILLPIVLILIGICFVLGVVLIVKSYMMVPLKQNLATAIRRRRRVGQAPDNNYIPQAQLRASQRMSCSSDRKSLPPPEVLMAARERASQLMSA